jgi:hypothetical protein
MPEEGTLFVLETHAKAAAGAHLVCGASASSVILLPSNFVHMRGIQVSAKKLQLPGINLPVPAIVAAALSMHRAAQLDESCEGELRHVMSKLDLVHAQVRTRKRIRQERQISDISRVETLWLARRYLEKRDAVPSFSAFTMRHLPSCRPSCSPLRSTISISSGWQSEFVKSIRSSMSHKLTRCSSWTPRSWTHYWIAM